MKSSFLKFLFFGFLFIQLACGEDPVEGVENIFAEYQSAIKQKQYDKAATLIDEKSVDYYTRIIKVALETERKKLGEFNFNSKLVALALRQEFSKKEIAALNGREVFAFAVEHRLNPMDSVEQYALAKTVMRGGLETAVSRMRRKGEVTDIYLKFLKEDGLWKINFASVMNEENDLNTSIVVSGIKDENKRAVEIVKALSDKRLKRNIWVPANRW